jgi:hypothetical protein
MGISQSINLCGSFPDHEASTNNLDSIVYDRFGNTYDRYSFPSPAGADTCIAGDFYLCFIGVPQEYQDVVCHVFTDLSNLIHRRENYYGCTPPEPMPYQELVVVYIKMVSASNYAASSSSYYRPDESHCNYNLNPSETYSIINGGRGHPGINPDAEIRISDVWKWNFSYDDAPVIDTLNPDSSEVDLRSVILHEALHIYGFSPLLTEDGKPFVNFKWFDFYDHSLYAYSNVTPDTIKIIEGDRAKNCWGLNQNLTSQDFNDIVKNNCDVNSYSIGFGNPSIAISASIADYTSKNVPSPTITGQLAHLSVLCNSNDTDLIMQPTIDRGIRRITITPKELEILCSLGYQIDSLSDCCPQVTYHESGLETNQYTCCTQVFYTCIDSILYVPMSTIICNDVSEDSMVVSDVWCSTSIVQIINDEIKITPVQQGFNQIFYTVKSCNDKMDNAYFEVFVGPCLDCEAETPCDNLICTYDFEEFEDDYVSPVFALGGLYWVFNYSLNLSNDKQNTVDICTDLNGNKYLSFFYEKFSAPSPTTDYREGIALKLKEGIKPGCKLKMHFDASVFDHPTQLIILGSTNPPCKSTVSLTEVGCVPTDCIDYEFKPICLTSQTSPLIIDKIGSNIYGSCPNVSSYDPYTFTYTNPLDSNTVINYLILYLDSDSTEDQSGIYLDNLKIISDCSCAKITSDQKTCNKYEFTADICNSENTYSWNFGDTLSGINNVSTSNPATHIFSNDGTYIVSLVVTDVCGNTSFKTDTIEINCPAFVCECPSGSSEVELQSGQITDLIDNPSITSFQNKCIKINGKVVINKDFAFVTCRVLMEPGAEIEVKTGKTFSASYSHFLGCTNMWKSITVLSGAKVNLHFDTIQDAEFGLHAFGGSTIKLQFNRFYLNYVGVFADGGSINQIAPMLGNRFYTNGSFLPTYTGQTNSPGAYGYCGVLVKNAVFSVGALTSSAPNYFYDLYNGIIGINSDLTATKANIHDLITIRSRLQPARKFSNADGDGIFTNNSTLTALSNTISVTNGAITDYQGKSLIAYDNNISNTVSGIYCAFPKIECYMDKNQITNYYLYGIGVSAPQSKIALMITRTDTFSSSTSSSLSGGSTAIYLENVVASNLAQVQGNKMILDPYANGIILKNCQNIGLQENSGTYNGITTRNGIGLYTSFSNVVYGNRIADTVSTPRTQGNAFFFNDSRANKVCCNYSSGTRSGFHFVNTSTMRHLLRTNQINHHRIGLECDTSTNIDFQFNAGNRWTGNYTNYSSAHFGSQTDIFNSRFHVANCTTQVWPKDPIFPTQNCNPIGPLNNDWFRKDGDGLTASCSTDTSACRKPFSTITRKTRGKGGGGGEGLFDDGSRNVTDTLIATRSMTVDNSFEARTVWEMSYDLLYRLKTHPAICEEDSIMNSYVLYNDTTNLGKFVQEDLDLDTLLTLSDSVLTLLQLRLYMIDSARMEIEIIDSILLSGSVSEEDSIDLVSQRMDWSIMTSNANLQIDTILSDYEEERGSALEQLETDLSDISPSSIIESNRKTVFNIYLNSAIRGQDTLTTAQFEDISPIAGSCSRSGGRSVILARQLYLLNEYFDFDEDSICEASEPEPVVLNTGANSLLKEQLSVYPNPSNGNFVVEVKQGTFPSKSQLYIYDLKGREVFHKSIDRECKKIEITKVDLGVVEGIFICKLISAGDLLYSPKIILHK